MTLSDSMRSLRPYKALASQLLASAAALLLLCGCSEKSELTTIQQIPELMRAYEVEGLAVTAVAADKVLIAEGFGVTSSGASYTSTSQCGLYSATKVLASLTYARLAEEGRIDLNAPLGTYLAENPDAPEAWAGIPFFRLLNHTSGITMAVNKPEFGEIAARADASNEDILRLVSRAPLDFQPGEFSRYRQSGYAIGEVILNEHVGSSFDTLVREYITRPAGMVQTVHPASTDPAQPKLIQSAGGYQTTADDMARLFVAINKGEVVNPSDWKNVLLDQRYVFDGYSLGSVIETREHVLTVGHSGGGARANIRYAPDEKVGVMVCTHDTQNHWLAITLANMLIQEITSGEPPKTPLLVALAGYSTMSADDLMAAYRAAAAQPDRYDLADSEPLLNMVGYTLMERGDMEGAVQVFTLNNELFPQSSNTYDSLGEALLESNDLPEALLQYQHVLKLDPDNANALAMIEKIEAMQREDSP